MAKLKYSKEQYLTWYKDMLIYRKLEEKAQQLYIQQKIRGFCHLYIGQEAIAAAVKSSCKHGLDKVISAYRVHVLPIAMGMHPKYVMAELLGKKTGCSKGKGGSMHMFSKEHNFFGGHGIVGGQIPLGAGMAFADKYKENNGVTLCFFGDGAIRQGAFHETMNMAMSWKLPCLFIVENNMYAMGTSVKRTSNVTNLYKLGSAYDMFSYQIDGMDVEKVHEGLKKGLDYSREGKGPCLIEINTYRYKGHSMSDPAKYRTKEEVEKYKSQDPINQILEKIKKNKLLTTEEVEKINVEAKDVIDESVKFAEDSDFPDKSELYEDIYYNNDYPFAN